MANTDWIVLLTAKLVQGAKDTIQGQLDKWKFSIKLDDVQLSDDVKKKIQNKISGYNDLKIKVSDVSFGNDFSQKLQEQLNKFNGLKINIESSRLDQKAVRQIQSQLDQHSFNININGGNIPNLPSNPPQNNNQNNPPISPSRPNNPRGNGGTNLAPGTLIDAWKDVTSPKIEVDYEVREGASEDLNAEIRREIERIQQSNATVVSVRYTTRSENTPIEDSNTGEIYLDKVEHITGATLKYTTAAGEAITKTLRWGQILDDTGKSVVFEGWTSEVTSYSNEVQKATDKTDSLVAQQTKRMSDLKNQVSQIYQTAIDPNASRSIKDQGHLDELKGKYQAIVAEIDNMGSTSKVEFAQQEANVTRLITELKNLKSQYKNMENISTSLNADKLEEAAKKAESQFASLQARIKNAGVDSQKLTDNVNIIDSALKRRANGEILNKSELEQVATALTVARNELTALIEIKTTNNALEKVKIDAQAVINHLDEMSKKNPTFDNWKHSLNGVEVTAQSLRDTLSNVTNTSELQVAKARVNEFESAFRTSVETAKVSASEFKKVQDSLANGTYEAQYQKMANKAASYVDENGKAIVSVERLHDALESIKTAQANGNDADLITNARLFAEEYKKVDNEINKTATSLNKVVTTQQRLSRANAIDTFLSKNTRLATSAKQELEGYSKALRNVGTAMSRSTFNDINNGFKQVEVRMRGLGKLGMSLSHQLQQAATSFTQWVSISSAIMLVVRQTRQAVTELKNVNTLLVEISKANDKLTKEDLASIGSNSFDVASKYGKAATDYLSGVQEASRAGYENAEAIAELSTAAQGAGDMTADLANQMLIATDKAYKLGGSVEKLRKILDGVNYITNHNAVNMTELSEGLSIVGSTAASFGIEVNELTAALGTMSATTQQSGSEVARAFRAILLNIRQVSDEEEGINAEGLTKYESACNALGVSLKEVKNGVQSLRDPMEVLRELSIEYNKLSETDIRRTELLNSVGGKLRSTQLDALLRQWSTYESMLQQYEDGIGSMAVEAEKTAQSWEGSLNRLNNTFIDTIGNIANSDGIIKIINGFNGLLSVVNKVTSSTGSINNIAAILGGIAGSQGLGFVNYGTDGSKNTIFEQFSNLRNLKQITKDSNDFSNIIVKIANDSNFASQDIDNLASTFTHCDKSVIQAAKSLQTGRMNLDDFRGIANSATTSLSGFAAGLKSVAVNMAIFFAISAAIQLVIKGLDKLIVTQDELNEKFDDSVDKYNDLKSEIQSLNTELESTKDTIEKLEELPSLTLIEQEQLRDLKETRKELERQLELKNALAKSRYSEAGQDARNYFASTSQYNTGYSINRDAISYKAGFVLQSSGSKFGNPIEEANAQLQIYEQLMEDIESTEIRILELKKDENYENSSAYKSAQKELSALNAKASEVNKSLSDSYKNFSAKKGYLDIDTDSELLNSISKFEDELYRVLSIGTSPTDKFNKLWDSSEFRSYKLELENISKLGKLDESVLSSNEKYKELLDATGLSASEVASHINSIVFAAENAGKLASLSSSFENAFNNLPIEKIEEYVAIANSDGFNKNNIESFDELNNIVKETGVSIDEVNSTIKTIAESGGFVLSVDLIKGIQDSYDVLEEVKKSFNDTKTIGLESLNKISAKYPELNTAIAQYNQGLISSEDLVHKLELAYQNDVEEYRSAMVEKLSSDEGFWNKVIEHNKEYFSDLSSAYGVDLQNYKTLAEAKAGIDAELIKKLSIGWSQYYDAIIDPLTGLATGGANFEGDENSDLLNGGHSENIKLVKQAADAYNESKKKLNEIAENAKNLISLPDFGSVDDDDTSSKSSGSSSSNKKEEIDWIARKNELLQKQHDIQEQIANDEAVSYNERKAALLDLIEKDKTLAATAEESAEKYKQAWLEASADLTASDRAKIANESDNMNIEKYDAKDLLEKGIVSSIEDGEEYIDNLKKSIEYYDLWKQYEQTAIDKKKEGEEHQRISIQLLQEEINKQLDLNSALADQVNTRMELLEAQGKYVNEGHYEELIRLSKEEVKYQQDSIDVLYEQLELEHEYSAEWYGVKAQIEAAENAIEQCRVEQEELNDQIKRLPIERIQIFRDLYAEVVEDMDNYMSIQSSMGLNPTKEELQQYIDLYNEQIDSALEQQDKLKDLLKDYEYGSEKFINTSKEIQDLDNEIASLIASQNEYNHQILQIPINEMAEQVDKLGQAKEALNNSIAEDNANGLKTTVQQYRDLHSITLQQLNVLAKQKSALTEMLSVYDEESDYYKEIEEQIVSIDSEMSGLVQETYQWNQELLNLPIENLSRVNENLNNYSSILDGVMSQYDSALTGVNTLVDKQIDGLQTQLDLLDETNEARQIQLGIEQSLYNLRRAEEQKTTQVIRNGELIYESDADALRSANQSYQDALLEKQKYDIGQQIESLEEIKDKWQEIIDKIQEAKDLQAAEDLFGSGWQDSVLSDTSDLRDLFQNLYESTSNQKEAVDKEIESNERISQMMNEFVTRYQEGSATYEQALSGINELIGAMDDGYTALENLSGMMDLDNIGSLSDIASSTQQSIANSADLLSKYMSIVESNRESVEGFETNWPNMAESIDATINSFNNAVNSIDSYIDVFNTNADAINANNKTWDEMKDMIADQIEALKKAAEELEKLSKQSSSKSSSSSSSSSRSDDGDGTYYRINGQRYHESEGSAAELITKHGTQDEQDSYWKYREKLITNNKNASDEGWKDAALKALEEEKSALKAHTGIFKGAIGQGSTHLDKILQDMAIINDDEHVRILQKGERVYTPDQILNTIDNAQRMSLPKAENLLSHLTSNPFTQTTSIDTAKVTDLIETGNKAIIPPNKQSIQNSVNVEFSGGITVNEVQNGEEFAHNLFTQISPVMEQKFSKLF